MLTLEFNLIYYLCLNAATIYYVTRSHARSMSSVELCHPYTTTVQFLRHHLTLCNGQKGIAYFYCYEQFDVS